MGGYVDDVNINANDDIKQDALAVATTGRKTFNFGPPRAPAMTWPTLILVVGALALGVWYYARKRG